MNRGWSDVDINANTGNKTEYHNNDGESQSDWQRMQIKWLDDRTTILEKESTNRLIQIITIFITFFTFVSVEFKILQNIPDIYTLIGLSLFLLGGLLGFAIIINKILIGADSKVVKNIDL